jgi:hypothetical protein
MTKVQKTYCIKSHLVEKVKKDFMMNGHGNLKEKQFRFSSIL